MGEVPEAIHEPGWRRRGVGVIDRGSRVELWATAWRMAEDNPLVGVGPDGLGRSFDAYRSERFIGVYGPVVLATDPHNLFLSYLATQGFPGLVGLSFLVGKRSSSSRGRVDAWHRRQRRRQALRRPASSTCFAPRWAPPSSPTSCRRGGGPEVLT